MTQVSSGEKMWQALDKFRSNGLQASDFIELLFALVYLRWVDFEEAEREAFAAFDDVGFEPVLSAEYQWRSWSNIRDPQELEATFEKLLARINQLSRASKDGMDAQLHCISFAVEVLIRNVAVLSQNSAETFVAVNHMLAEQPFETPADRIAIRDMLDEVLRESFSRFPRGLGLALTPKPVVELMVALGEPKFGESLRDPCFGSAGFLTEAFDYVREHQFGEVRSGRSPLKISGADIKTTSFMIGVTRLALTGVIDLRLEFRNSLERLPPNDLAVDGVDLIISQPPWNEKIKDQECPSHYPIQTSDSVGLFIQNALSELCEGGRAVFAVPPGFLFRAGSVQRIRKMLLEEHSVEAVVSLPAGLFKPYTNIPSNIIVLRKGGTTSSVRMVEFFGEVLDELSESFLPHSFSDIAKFVHDPDSDGLSSWGQVNAWDEDAKTLAEFDYDLTPKRREHQVLRSFLDEMPDGIDVLPLGQCCEIFSGTSISKEFLCEPPGIMKSDRETLQTKRKLNETDDPSHPVNRKVDFKSTSLEFETKSFMGMKIPVGVKSWPGFFSEIKEQRGTEEDWKAYSKFLEGMRPYIRVSDIHKGRIKTKFFKDYIHPLLETELCDQSLVRAPKYQPLRYGDFLFSKSGTVGKVAVVDQESVGGVANANFFVLRVDGNILDPEFLLAYLSNSDVFSWIQAQSVGASIRHIKKGIIQKLPVPLPPLQMQKKIATAYKQSGADALKLLRSLVQGEEQNQLSKWLDSRLFDLSEQKTESLTLGQWRTLSESFPVVRNKIAHGRIDAGSLEAWAMSFNESIKPLQGVEGLPNQALYSVLVEISRRLIDAENALEGNSPDTRTARSVTEKMRDWLKFTINAMLSQSHLRIASETTEILSGETTTVTLQVANESVLPLRSLSLRGDCFSDVHIPYLEADGSTETEIKIVAPQEEDYFDVSILWNCLNLVGDQLSGSEDLRFSVDSLSVSEAKVVDLGSSPYICGNAILPDRNDVFFGRQDLIDQIKRRVLRSGDVVLLEGNRRSGKSSILRQLEGVATIPGWLAVYCTLDAIDVSIDGGSVAASLFRYIAEEVMKSVRKLKLLVILPDGSVLDANQEKYKSKKALLAFSEAIQEGISEEAPYRDFKEYIEIVLEKLAEQDLRLLLMLDEFDGLQRHIDDDRMSPQVLLNIRALIQSCQNLSAVITGTRRLKRMREKYWSALFGLGTRFGVTSLPLDAATRLITEPVAGKLSYNSSAVRRAYELTAGQAYLLQGLCDKLFDLASRGTGRSITVDQINEAVDELVVENEFFSECWRDIEFGRRRLLLFLLHREADGPDPMSLGTIQAKLEQVNVDLHQEIIIQDLEYLRELELVDLHSESSGAYYTLTIPMMGRWLESQHDYEVILSRARAEILDSSANLQGYE